MKKLLFTLTCLLISFCTTAQCYSVASIPYQVDTMSNGSPTNIVGDDQWSTAIPIGFTFCFYGEQYDSLLIGSNGMITFDLDTAQEYCPWPITNGTVPSSIYPANTVMVPWVDLSVTSGSHIYWWTAGVAPNRTFNVVYDSMLMYQCAQRVYTRAILHESTNEIEIHLSSKPYCSWNNNKAIIGIQNQNATSGVAAPGRNAMMGGWNASYEAWLFTPTCDVCTGVSVGENVGENFVRLYPNPTSGATAVSLSQGHSFSTIEIVDAMGRVVERRAVVQGTAQTIEFSIAVAGIYFVRMMNTEQEAVRTEKLIVE